MDFLTGKDYPHLCDYCQKAIDDAAEIHKLYGADTDDPEAPIMLVSDRQMFCGGKVCKESEAYIAQTEG